MKKQDAINVESVPMWVVSRGVGHIVVSRDDSSPIGTRTACGLAGNFVGATYYQSTTPERKCRDCVRALPLYVKVPGKRKPKSPNQTGNLF